MKSIIISIVLILSISKSHAQDYKRLVGIQLKPGFTHLNSQLISTSETIRLSPAVSLTFEQNILGEYLSIQSGLNYYDRGSKTTALFNDPTGNTIDYHTLVNHNHYLEIPLSIKGRLKGFHISLGLQGNSYLGSVSYLDGEELSSGKSEYLDDFALGWNAEFGYQRIIIEKFLIDFTLGRNVLLNTNFRNTYLAVGFNYILPATAAKTSRLNTKPD